MNFFRRIFGAKGEAISSNEDFWNWFRKNEWEFFNVVKSGNAIEENLFNRLTPKLDQIREEIYFLTGMEDDQTAELIFTAEGNPLVIPFVEDLVKAAPGIPGWRFTALKPPLNIEDVQISMAGFSFDKDSLWFYSNDLPEYPDEIDITLVHAELNESNKREVTNGMHIFLDNYLGELNFLTSIDNLSFRGKADAEKQLIPIEKLKDYLLWREKEFVEKYQGARYLTDKDTYSILEGNLAEGEKLIALINRDLLDWDSKASHPWLSVIKFGYNGMETKGMPSEEDYEVLDSIEREIREELKDSEGYLNAGRQTGGGVRKIYLYCREFRKPSRVFHEIRKKYQKRFEISAEIYKDKYWQTLSRYSSRIV